ncbi:uncharacterized protein A4U43_C08F13390 [Asparagus officinalis]|nr:uncharacterized protein A4U43_C08F13390 [Asparagus officinalis]
MTSTAMETIPVAIATRRMWWSVGGRRGRKRTRSKPFGLGVSTFQPKAKAQLRDCPLCTHQYFGKVEFGLQLEGVIACVVINYVHIDVEFEFAGGLDKIKQELFELVILPLRRPELFTHGKVLSLQNGVLLCGSPGTGKTMLAKAIANDSGAVFINVRVSNLMSIL